MISIRYGLDKRQLRSVERDLKKLGSKMPTILSRVANKTATSARMSLARELQGAYTEKPSKLKQNIEIEKASRGDPVAAIRVSGKAQPAIYFHHLKGGRGGAKLQVRTGGSPVALVSKTGRRAFIAKMPSGHKGIYQRRAGRYMKKAPRMSRANIAKKSQHTEWIKQIHSPSPVKMVERVYGSRSGLSEKMGPGIEGLFQKYFGQQIELVLRKRKRGGT